MKQEVMNIILGDQELYLNEFKMFEISKNEFELEWSEF